MTHKRGEFPKQISCPPKARELKLGQGRRTASWSLSYLDQHLRPANHPFFSPEAMAMATREHKGDIHGALLNNILYSFKAATPFAPQPLRSKMSGRSASVSVGTDAMVCVECFRMKGDQDLKVPCQNPRCYFYLQAPGYASGDPKRDSSSPGPIFKKEVGYDRSSSGRVRPKPSDFLLSAGKRPSSSSSGNARLHDNIWAFRPENRGYMGGKPSQQTSKIRSQSISVGSNGTLASNNRGPSTNVNHRVNMQSSAEIEKAKLMRKRMMSMPLVAGMESLMDGGAGDSDSLVEDAFLSSPLPEFAAMVERPNPGVVGQKIVSLRFNILRACSKLNYYTQCHTLYACTVMQSCKCIVHAALGWSL